jgi:hypothetical protein
MWSVKNVVCHGFHREDSWGWSESTVLEGIAIIVKFQQCATFSELVDLALQTWNQSFHFTQIISFGNDLFLESGKHIKDEVFEDTALQMAHAFQRFSAGCQSPQREVVFGGVASQWDVQNRDVFQSRIQSVMGRFRELTDLNAPHMELTHAESWVSGLNSSHWKGFHLHPKGPQHLSYSVALACGAGEVFLRDVWAYIATDAGELARLGVKATADAVPQDFSPEYDKQLGPRAQAKISLIIF